MKSSVTVYSDIMLLILLWVSEITVFCLMFFPIFLLGYQIYLISVNLLSYEILKPKNCIYLDYNEEKEEFRKTFSQGIIQNWIQFVLDPSKVVWKNHLANKQYHVKQE
jgi:hypothetical protein